MLAFTLDHNCIIDLEDNRPAAPCIRTLLARHKVGELIVRLVAASASERQRDGGYLDNFSFFRKRLASLGLGHLQLLMPTLTLDVSYLDWCILASEEDISLQNGIHNVLFPQEAFDLQEAWSRAAPDKGREATTHKWQNRLLDVQTLWCHIYYNGNVFVTSDNNFFKQTKREPLAKLGATTILRPCEAASWIGNDDQ